MAWSRRYVNRMTRAPDALQRRALARWCSADPGPRGGKAWVPGLQRAVRFANAALRPGHEALACVSRHCP